MDGTAGVVGLRVQSRVEVEQNLDPGRVLIQVLLMAVNLVQVLQEIDQHVIQKDVQVCCNVFRHLYLVTRQQNNEFARYYYVFIMVLTTAKLFVMF